jgi:hypothetical protein
VNKYVEVPEDMTIPNNLGLDVRWALSDSAY